MVERGSPSVAQLAARVRRIRTDRRSGAHPLGIAALTLVRDGLRLAVRRRRPVPLRELEEIGRRLLRAQPTMAPVITAGEMLVRAVRGRPTRRRLEGRRRSVEGSIRAWRGEAVRLVRRNAPVFPPEAVLLTISNSSTVRRLLAALPPARRPLEVRVLRSLPGGEGALAARDLRRHGVPARVVEDGDAALAIRDADLVLVGADAVEPDGAVVHKIGTRPLAELAHRAHVPVVVVAGSSKRAPRRLQLPSPGRYDRTPLRFVAEFWTDAGRRTPAEMRRARG